MPDRIYAPPLLVPWASGIDPRPVTGELRYRRSSLFAASGSPFTGPEASTLGEALGEATPLKIINWTINDVRNIGAGNQHDRIAVSPQNSGHNTPLPSITSNLHQSPTYIRLFLVPETFDIDGSLYTILPTASGINAYVCQNLPLDGAYSWVQRLVDDGFSDGAEGALHRRVTSGFGVACSTFGEDGRSQGESAAIRVVEVYRMPGPPPGAIEFIEGTGEFKWLAGANLPPGSTSRGGSTVMPLGPAIRVGNPLFSDQPFWEALYNANRIGNGGVLPDGWTYNVQYPVTRNYAYLMGEIPVGLSCDPVGLDRLVYDIARRAGVPPHRIDVSALTGDLFGFGIGRPASGRQQIEILQQYGFFDATDYKGMLRFRMRDRTPNGTIGGEDLSAHVFGEQRPSAAERTRSEDYELPREVRVQYLQTEAEFEPGMQLYERRLTDAQGVADIDLTAIAMTADKAAAIAEISMLEAIVAREGVDFSLVATTANKALIPSDIKTLDVDGELQTVRLAQLDYAWPGVQAWKAVRHDPSIYASDAVGISSRLPRNPIVVPGDTTLELLDAPLVRLVDDVSGYFAAMGGTPTVPGIIEGWPGGDLFRQEAEGLEDIARLTRPGSYFGDAVNDPGAAPVTIRTAGPLIVTSSGPLASITLEALLLGGNLAALEVRDGGDRIGWEIIQYQSSVRDEDTGQFTLTNLLRGRFGTEWAIGLHAIGDRFVTLPNVAQILTESDELNLERAHRAATIGRDPENADPVDFAWEGVDRIPYAPVHLAAEREGNDDLTLTWTRRDRVGRELVSGQALPLSESSEAYEVDIYDTDGTTVLRTLQVSAPTATYTSANQATDFGLLPTELDWDVRQMGSLGRGYAGRIESEGL